ncbi:MAG TPA: D-arabinono-1,4-lactone oxidase [Jiangellaceae bacterium]
MVMTNWAGNVAYSADRVCSPTSIAELQGLIAQSRRVRALGSRHSFNDIADTPGVLVSVEAIPIPLVVDHDAWTVTVGGGVRYAELARDLHTSGVALANLGSLPHITVAGSVATGTHGSGDGNANLASAVSALEMVTAEGELITLRRGADRERFAGAVVALGALGVVVSLTLDVVPAFNVRQCVYDGLEWSTLTTHLDEIFASGYSVSVFTGWRSDLVGQVWVKRRTDDPREAETELFGARLATEPRHPIDGMPVENSTPQLGIPGPWHERLPHFRAEFTPSVGEEIQSEYLVPREHAVAALLALARVRERIGPVLQVGELRTVAADELWLSPGYRRDLLAIHFTWVKDMVAVRPAMRAVEEALEPFGPRPHWGKVFTLSAEAVQSRYPRLSDFRKLLDELDPGGKFRNDFVERHISPHHRIL